MPSAIPSGMLQNTSHTQQHSDTIRSRRLLESTTQDDSNSSRKHCSETITSIYIPSTRECRTFPSNTTWTSQSTQTPTGEQLWHTSYKHTSHHAMDGEARSLPTQQVRSTLWPQHKLLQTMEQRTQNTNMWVWWNSSLHVTNSKAQAQDGSTILSSHLARQRHLNKRKHPGHIPTDCQSKDNQETSKARQVQQNRWWTSSTPHLWQHQRWLALSSYQQGAQAHRSKQQPQQKHRHNSHSNHRFRQEIDLRQHRQLPMYLWQHHQHHTTGERHYQQHQNETWQMT